MTRRGNPNYIAAACGFVGAICYFFLPLFLGFVSPFMILLGRVSVVRQIPMVGKFSLILVLPLLLMIGVVLASLLLDERAAPIYDGVTAGIFLVIYLLGHGTGALLSLIAAAAACVLEILLNNRRPAPPPTPDPWY